MRPLLLLIVGAATFAITGCSADTLRPIITVGTVPLGTVQGVDVGYFKVAGSTIVIDTSAPIEDTKTPNAVLFVRIDDAGSTIFSARCHNKRPAAILRELPSGAQGYVMLADIENCFVIKRTTTPQPVPRPTPSSPPPTLIPV